MFEPNAQDAPMSEIDAELARLESEMPDPARFTACWLGGSQESLGEFADHVQRLLEQLPSNRTHRLMVHAAHGLDWHAGCFAGFG